MAQFISKFMFQSSGFIRGNLTGFILFLQSFYVSAADAMAEIVMME